MKVESSKYDMTKNLAIQEKGMVAYTYATLPTKAPREQSSGGASRAEESDPAASWLSSNFSLPPDSANNGDLVLFRSGF